MYFFSKNNLINIINSFLLGFSLIFFFLTLQSFIALLDFEAEFHCVGQTGLEVKVFCVSILSAGMQECANLPTLFFALNIFCVFVEKSLPWGKAVLDLEQSLVCALS